MKKSMTSMLCMAAFLAVTILGISTALKADEKDTLCPACNVVTTDFNTKYNVGTNPVKKMQCPDCKTSFEANVDTLKKVHSCPHCGAFVAQCPECLKKTQS